MSDQTKLSERSESHDRREINTITVPTYGKYCYGFTIYGSKTPEMVTNEDLLSAIDRIEDQAPGIVTHKQLELKSGTNVLHYHCIILTNKKISYKKMSKLSKGYHTHFDEIKTLKDYINWESYITKEKIPDPTLDYIRQQQLIQEHYCTTHKIL